ncbi:MAG: tetratricopeptide repeat protein, partial [Oscillatoria sp. PMC 1051.18]|nr:tetratricopeptide repeat protein [Oscillatoria sp. PMC 1050.18]MEC5030081.1 tetratricopeptide repeat protein [Oscillatoria sp. PMC 1051.18]
IEFHQQQLEIAREIGDRRGEANSWFNLGNSLAKLKQKSSANNAYLHARELYQGMGLDTDVEDCNNAIHRLRRKSTFAPRFPQSFWRWLNRLWRLLRARLRR